jgi:hypothetical protein
MEPATGSEAESSDTLSRLRTIDLQTGSDHQLSHRPSSLCGTSFKPGSTEKTANGCLFFFEAPGASPFSVLVL